MCRDGECRGVWVNAEKSLRMTDTCCVCRDGECGGVWVNAEKSLRMTDTCCVCRDGECRGVPGEPTAGDAGVVRHYSSLDLPPVHHRQ